ncbi:sporulation protein YqfC [Aquibacillus sp. 3ASR75-11]|uniref:Sporulation protein YqfC n=1 Tax=Terrihalobacillus insolitus TaxID=2950438 RepID=A0A9X3WRZ5_9BACI|nr:sporulation protein YqfC [Terrihalobacillus insolitus]MDC3413349.1 sporulation protein YqfC [Terrihalobacillus insolitus]MDC3424932.1 sporulation protein YqfC [Terrihalobacillus insolitus]
MSKWQQHIGNWLTEHLELPSDVVLELPRITTIGQLHVYIENHRGIVLFSDQELRLKMKQGYLKIVGENFVLKMMLPEEILLEGKVTQLLFINE